MYSKSIFLIFFCIILFIIKINLLNKYSKIKERFIEKKIIFLYPKWLNGQLYYSDIFPLKKYTFYNHQLYGPNKTHKLLKFYSKKGKDVMKYAIRKYGLNSEVPFKIREIDYKPANIDMKNYKGSICTKYTKRCNYFNGKNYYIPPCCAHHLTEIIFYLIDLLTKHNITYFIYWGTLLGSIRHGGIIPWDTDIDIYIHKNDKSKLTKLKSLIEKETHYILEVKNIIRLNYSKLNMTHVDIFLYKFD